MKYGSIWNKFSFVYLYQYDRINKSCRYSKMFNYGLKLTTYTHFYLSCGRLMKIAMFLSSFMYKDNSTFFTCSCIVSVNWPVNNICPSPLTRLWSFLYWRNIYSFIGKKYKISRAYFDLENMQCWYYIREHFS